MLGGKMQHNYRRQLNLFYCNFNTMPQSAFVFLSVTLYVCHKMYVFNNKVYARRKTKFAILELYFKFLKVFKMSISIYMYKVIFTTFSNIICIYVSIVSTTLIHEVCQISVLNPF